MLGLPSTEKPSTDEPPGDALSLTTNPMASKKSGKKQTPEAPRPRGGFKASRHGDGKRKASAAGN